MYISPLETLAVAQIHQFCEYQKAMRELKKSKKIEMQFIDQKNKEDYGFDLMIYGMAFAKENEQGLYEHISDPGKIVMEKN